MTKTFVVYIQEQDPSGEILKLDGMKVKKPLYVLKNFAASFQNLIGQAIVYTEGNNLMAKVEVDDDIKGLYPAVVYSVDKFHWEGRTRIVDSWTLSAIGVGGYPNIDSKIKTI